MQSLRYLRLTAVLTGIFCSVGTFANAQNVRQLGPERVSVKAEAVALGALLDQLAAITPMEKIRIDPADRLVPVSLDAEDLGPLEAMGLVLKASGLDFVMSNKRIVVGRAAKAAASATADEKSERLADRTVDRSDRRSADSADEDAERRRTDDHRIIATPGLLGGIIDRPELQTSLSQAAAPPAAAMEAENTVLDDSTPPPDQFGPKVGAREVPFAVHEDSVTIQQPNFVPYKLRPEVVKRRLATQIAIIP
jgi:hypothetical protein